MAAAAAAAAAAVAAQRHKKRINFFASGPAAAKPTQWPDLVIWQPVNQGKSMCICARPRCVHARVMYMAVGARAGQ